MVETFIIVGLIGLAGGLLVGAYEVLFWLKKGVWPRLTMEWPFGAYIPGDSSGFSQIAVWFWEQPLWGVLFGVGLLMVGLGIAASSNR